MRENPLHGEVLAPVIEAVAVAEANLIEQDPDLPLRRGRGPRVTSTPQPAGVQALQDKIGDLERAVRTREEHIAIVAHDLRGPLSPMMLLVRRLLDATRLQTHDLHLEPEDVDLVALVHEVASAMSRDRTPPIPIRVDAEREVIGRWDRLRVEEIVRNLLSNALRFGALQPIDVVVTTRGELAVFAVRDRGAGIQPQDRERIFENYVRLRKTGDGFGLGLWIVRQLTEAMGGMVECDSDVGRGSTFTVTLPCRPRGVQ